MTAQQLTKILEALIFTAPKPLTLLQLTEIISEASPTEIEEALSALKARYHPDTSGLWLCEVAAGYQFRSHPDTAPWLFKMNKAKPVRLGRATLETLAIVAYRQPCTKPEVDDIRGVDSGHILRQLLERNLVKILGKRDEPGNPLIYGTTPEFLAFFGLRSLGEMPTLREFTELGEDSLQKLQELLPEQKDNNAPIIQASPIIHTDSEHPSDASA